MNEEEVGRLEPGDKVIAWLNGFEPGPATVVGFDEWGYVIVAVQFPVRAGQLRAVTAAAEDDA